MEPIFHTIALEPERWKPARVSRPLIELLPAIQSVGLQNLEVYEPHLLMAPEPKKLPKAFAEYELTPLILSSYLDLNPAATTDAELKTKTSQMTGLISEYGFRKVRIFGGLRMRPDDAKGAKAFAARLGALADQLPETEFLVETHDLSLADDPQLIFNLVCDLGLDNVGLLFQPTIFEREAALNQFFLQECLIRHVHLQNRDAEGKFCALAKGLVNWDQILYTLGDEASCTIEFVPASICPTESFDLKAVLKEIRAEAEFVRSIEPS